MSISCQFARKLIQQYVDGWKENNLNKIISCLTSDCTVIESHGPTYYSVEDIKKWFSFWLQGNGKVEKWEIASFYFIETEQTALFEWDFSCVSQGVKYHLPGISVVRFIKDKISFIHEYRMTHKAYKGDKKSLAPEYTSGNSF